MLRSLFFTIITLVVFFSNYSLIEFIKTISLVRQICVADFEMLFQTEQGLNNLKEMYLEHMRILIFSVILAATATSASAHGEGVYSCKLALRADFERPKENEIPPIIRIVTAHYETDDIGVLAWWGPHNSDPQNNVRIESYGRGEAAIYTEMALRWKKTKPEIVMRPTSETWEAGKLHWSAENGADNTIGSFTCEIFLTEY